MTLHIKTEVHDVAVLDDVVFSFHGHFTCFFAFGF